MNGCRSFIVIDECHLKGPYRGVLLLVVGLDVNNGFFPVMYTVVEAENNITWWWFLYALYEPIKNGVHQRPFCIMFEKIKVYHQRGCES